MFIHSRLYYEGQWEKQQRTINIAEWLLDLLSMYLATNNFPLGFPEKLVFCYSHKKEEITVLH